jgi:hypothetical protein
VAPVAHAQPAATLSPVESAGHARSAHVLSSKPEVAGASAFPAGQAAHVERWYGAAVVGVIVPALPSPGRVCH